jgi:hypothetical protein
MPMIRIYRPTPVVLPEDADLSRDLTCDPRYPREDDVTRPAAGVYDRQTIFYDVFLAASGKLIAIGPPLLNLAPHLLPVQIFLRAAGLPDLGPLEPRIDQTNRNCVILRADLRSAYAERPLSVRLVFANGLEATVTTEAPDLPDRLVSLSTLQRDNRIAWIRDWITYHHELGVDRVLFYDNGSREFSSIYQMLARLSVDLDIVVVPWDFPFGIVAPSKYFCKSGYMNHAHMRFAQTSWFLNLDVDEYLVSADPDFALPAYLAGQSAWTGLIGFDGYWMPNIPTECRATVPTVREFHWRDRRPGGKFGKYILRSKAYRFSKTHSARIKPLYRDRRVAADTLAYLHYKAITTNWRHEGGGPEPDRLLPDQYQAGNHVPDHRVIEVLRRHENPGRE